MLGIFFFLQNSTIFLCIIDGMKKSAEIIEINNENEPNNVKDQIDIESNNSCLNKSLCRG